MATKSTDASTPLMKQYAAFKSKHPDCILLFRVGDFYETFGPDAVITARVLGIVLTKRANGSASEIELAGFPHHAIDNYLPKLVKAGYRVAVCEQLEDPKFAKGLVKRGITEIVTPGTTLSEKILDHKQANYLACFGLAEDRIPAVAFLELSTGEFFCLSGDEARIIKLMDALKPGEVLVPRKDKPAYQERFGDQYYTNRIEDWSFAFDAAKERLLKQFNIQSLKAFALEDEKAGVMAAGAILHYLDLTEKANTGHICKLYRLELDEFMLLDKFTLRNLEVLVPLQPDGKSLFEALDRTVTPMGARLLRRWLGLPLQTVDKIRARHQAVAALVDRPQYLAELTNYLKAIGDLERLNGRLAMRRIIPRELIHLKHVLALLPKIEVLLTDIPELSNQRHGIVVPAGLNLILDTYLFPEPAGQPGNGGVIANGVSETLDEYRSLHTDAIGFLEKLRLQEVERTGISSLKISYNKVFGYYIEISNTRLDRVPDNYVRKQTLANAERFITPELKHFEEKALEAESQIAVLETALYQQLLDLLQPGVPVLQAVAQTLSELDVYQGFAHSALLRNYVKPTVILDGTTEILEGRHPVIEQTLPPDSPYIPNDVVLDNETYQILLITGPNMAGKSALLRQTALIVLMAQAGSFVPATEATIMIADRLYSRVGATDNLAAGESTFMVEMTETARILHGATRRSLILLDEIGRGTSTFDGVAIAWAVTEYLHNHLGARTLFATHYHELSELAAQLTRVHNYHVSVEERQGRMLFMRKLKPGPGMRSFGVQVAAMAGLPLVVVERAAALLQQFEQNQTLAVPDVKKNKAKNQQQLSLFQLKDYVAERLKTRIESIDPDRLTPVEALLLITELKRIVEEVK